MSHQLFKAYLNSIKHTFPELPKGNYYWRFHKRDLNRIITLPCPIKTPNDDILQYKELRSKLGIKEDFICPQCPHHAKCPHAFKQGDGGNMQTLKLNLLAKFLVDVSESDVTINDPKSYWLAGNRILDTFHAVIMDFQHNQNKLNENFLQDMELHQEKEKVQQAENNSEELEKQEQEQLKKKRFEKFPKKDNNFRRGERVGNDDEESGQQQQQRFQKNEKQYDKYQSKNNKSRSYDQYDNSDKSQRYDRNNRNDRYDKNDRQDRYDKNDRQDRNNKKYNNSDRYNSSDRYDTNDRYNKNDRYQRQDAKNTSAERTGRYGDFERTQRKGDGDKYVKKWQTDLNQEEQEQPRIRKDRKEKSKTFNDEQDFNTFVKQREQHLKQQQTHSETQSSEQNTQNTEGIKIVDAPENNTGRKVKKSMKFRIAQ